jgi:hypothetical protein
MLNFSTKYIILSKFKEYLEIILIFSVLLFSKANGFTGSVELIKEELGRLLWKAVDEENVAEIKEMLDNCGAYVDETCQLEGYEGMYQDYKGPFTLATFAAISSAIFSF